MPNPGQYVLVLRPDGTYDLQADCHSGSSTYALEADRLALDLGPLAGQVCPPESLHDLYLEKLNQVNRYTVEDGHLVLILAKDAGRMVFGDTGPAQPGGSGTPPQSETPAASGTALLFDTTWQWAGLLEMEATSDPSAPGQRAPEPGAYTVTFHPDGGLQIRADCNVGTGAYTLEDQSLSIVPGAMTEAYCGEDSLDGKYLELLGQATAFKIEDGWLVLSLGDGADRMIFSHGGPAE